MSNSIKTQLFQRASRPPLVPLVFAGVECFIKPWTERDRIEWAQYINQLAPDADGKKQDATLRARALAWSLCDAEGHPVFDRAEYEQLLTLPATDIDEAFAAVMAVQSPKDDDAKKNSSTTPS
ncbi:MAG TPA: hypothetical protein VG713_18965 [Pirellulales bacterium]|nr:hypothetical protein [Pirellulales bacterium]